MNSEIAQPPVTAPGVPPGYPEPKQLETEDCIKPSEPDGMTK